MESTMVFPIVRTTQWRAVNRSYFLGAVLLALSPSCLGAYPEKPIKIVTPFPAGSVTDVMARPIAAKLTESVGQPVIVENRPGAGGNLAGEFIAKSAPDGYTLLMGTWNTNAINASLYKKMPYNTLEDFSPISMTASTYLVLITHPSLPVYSVRDLIALAKARPGQLNFGSGGSGSSPHLAGELFKSMTGVRMTHIPYKGSPQSTIDLIAGRLDLIFASQATALPHIKTGRVRLLATTNNTRVPEMPEVPTISEAGVRGFEIKPWYGLFVATGTPRPIVEKLNGEVVKILAMPDVKTIYANAGLAAGSTTPAAFSAYIVSEYHKWAKVIAASGMTAD